jgi:hypothetical protein
MNSAPSFGSRGAEISAGDHRWGNFSTKFGQDFFHNSDWLQAREHL